MCRAPDGKITDVLPPPFSARTTAHEYGGGALLAADDTVYFSNYADQRIWRIKPGEPPQPLTPEGKLRFADCVLDRARNRLIGVCEDHTRAGSSRRTASSLSTWRGALTTLVSGPISIRRRASAPTASNSPGSPGIIPTCPGTAPSFRRARSKPTDRSASREQSPAAKTNRSFSPPGPPTARSTSFPTAPIGGTSTPSATAKFARVADGRRVWHAAMGLRHVHLWLHRRRPHRRPIYQRRNLASGAIDPRSGKQSPLETTVHHMCKACTSAAIAPIAFASSADRARFAHRNRFDQRQAASHSRKLADQARPAPTRRFPQAIEFPTDGGKTAHAFFYPPANRRFSRPAGRSAAASGDDPRRADRATPASFSLSTQYWTSRGYRRVRRELRRQHRLWPRISQPPARQLGHGRRGRRHQRRPLSGQPRQSRPEETDHPRRQRRRLHHAGLPGV